MPKGELIPLDRLLPHREGREVFLDQAALLHAGSVMRRMREHAQMAQGALAERLGIPVSRLQQIEGGLDMEGPTFLLLSKAARACGLTLLLWVDGAEDDPELNPELAGGRLKPL
jgi:transcriptional regulator with XRE-family HTH domain